MNTNETTTQRVADELVRMGFRIITDATVAWAARRAGVAITGPEGRHARELAYRAMGVWRPAPTSCWAFLGDK